jgi:hypothetical protein
MATSALTNHFAPYLKDTKVGDVAYVPYGDFEMESIRGALCGHLSHNWGNGSYMIHKTATNIEVLRLEMKNLATALVKAQKAFSPALKKSTNPHFKSRYADLASCVDAVMDA